MAALIRQRSFSTRLTVSLRSAVVSSFTTNANDVENETTESKRETGSTWESPKLTAPPEYRFIFPEFLPKVDHTMRNSLREKLERMDMLNRRRIIEIPEFYVGSIMAVTASDRFSPGKINRFVGICIHRGGEGLRATFRLRNVVDHQGVEIMYDMYNPTLRKIEVLRLEKRLDDELFYLRDALPEYSTFPFEMEPEIRANDSAEVPINPLKVKLKPRPWLERWERKELKGVEDLGLPEKFYKRAKELATPWEKYDLMKEYRRLICEEEQSKIYTEVYAQQMQLEKTQKKEKKQRVRRTIMKSATTPTYPEY